MYLVKAYCYFCNSEIDSEAPGTYRKVVGWTKNRAQGGTNSITLPSAPMGFACKTCIDLQKLKGEGWNADANPQLF